MPRKMSEEREKEFDDLARFLEFYCTRIEGISPDRPEHPSRGLERFVADVGKSKAMPGLKQAINDVIEATIYLTSESLKRIDDELHKQGIVTLSELRRRHSVNYRRILKRGRIKDDTEYYLITGVLCDVDNGISDVDRDFLSKLVAQYES